MRFTATLIGALELISPVLPEYIYQYGDTKIPGNRNATRPILIGGTALGIKELDSSDLGKTHLVTDSRHIGDGHEGWVVAKDSEGIGIFFEDGSSIGTSLLDFALATFSQLAGSSSSRLAVSSSST